MPVAAAVTAVESLTFRVSVPCMLCATCVKAAFCAGVSVCAAMRGSISSRTPSLLTCAPVTDEDTSRVGNSPPATLACNMVSAVGGEELPPQAASHRVQPSAEDVATSTFQMSMKISPERIHRVVPDGGTE